MKYLVTGKEMKDLDEATASHFSVPPEILMEQAAMQFVRRLLREMTPQKVLVVCGSGNNGGDGIAIARLLLQAGVDAFVWFPAGWEEEKASPLCRRQHLIYESYGYPVVSGVCETDAYDLVVDAMFGTGLSRGLSGEYAKAAELVNAMPAKVYAVDIASGISSDTGEAFGTAVRADATITFSFGKVGQYLSEGAACSGRIFVEPIGITKESFLGSEPKTVCLEQGDLSLLPKRYPDSHKGTYGKLLVAAGSKDMAGAAIFAAKAAYRMGAGLVKVLTHKDNRTTVLSQVPEAVLSTYEDYLNEEQIRRELEWADAVVIGPGIGMDTIAEALLHIVVCNAKTPLLLDADALNLISEKKYLFKCQTSDIIVTPHIGEMARLTGQTAEEIRGDLLGRARSFAKENGVICVLKNFRTVTALANGRVYLNQSGNDGMATAGSGDVLSGVIGALLAMGMKADLAAPLGVYIHGCAGDKAAKWTGRRALIASDITDGLAILSKEETDAQDQAENMI